MFELPRTFFFLKFLGRQIKCKEKRREVEIGDSKLALFICLLAHKEYTHY
jgi:hypothetical protein